MNCPSCNKKTRITDTRAHERGTWRRHKCACSNAFTTMEIVCDTVISKKGRPFGAVANPTRSQQPKLNKPPIGIKVPKISAPIAHPKAKHATPARLRIEAMREAKEMRSMFEGNM